MSEFESLVNEYYQQELSSSNNESVSYSEGGDFHFDSNGYSESVTVGYTVSYNENYADS